ncbi:MAG: hypothetical protein A2X32_10375 [Elusimicrobia bacterium GWC2_64_44]|nr:MAG: hypothetical protein A2X32_10375 [Elusimicrobia bacterium GWC2_64_44]
MKKAALLFLALLPAAFTQRAGAVGEMSGGSVALSRWAANSQGQVSSGAGFNLYSSVGETAFSSAAAGGLAVNPGYMKVAAQPGTIVSITAVTKATGTLELAWAAPGADGFLGGITGGVYRLDYSSDPLHSFSPTTFLTEFSTSVTAGSAQRLDIPGLQANTTYYTKIYFGDSGKMIAADSALSAESTLADLPVDPFFSAVNGCDATISWALPGSGARGYSTDSSTTSFGVLSPGGEVSTVGTPDGLQANLVISGLAPGSTYYFRVASLNWQGNKNFTTLISTVTPRTLCRFPVSGLSAFGDALSRAVTLTWVNPASPSLEGVVIMLSTSAAPAPLPDGSVLTPGQVLADGSIVKSTQAAAPLGDSGLTLDTTYFYHLMTRYTGPVYSVGVSTNVFLDLPPMAPAGLTADLNADGTAVTLNWNGVTSNLDGSAFKAPAAPMGVELARYRVEKSSSVGMPSWVAVATLPASAQSYVDAVAPGDPAYIYRIASLDSLGTEERAMAVDTRRGVYVFAPDQVARLEIPASLSGELLAANSPYGSNILIRSVNEGSDAPRSIYNSVRFEAVRTPGNEVLENFSFSRPELTVAVRYEVSGGRVVPSGAGAQAVTASDAAQRLGLYWNNGEKYVKLYGKIDTVNQLASVQSSMLGSYQIRSLYRDSGVHFDISNLSNRAITPNGDGLNDSAVFTFDNPRDSAFSGKIYDLSGAFVADMTPGPVVNSLVWDGKANGRAVSGGAYVYQIRSEERTFNGTLLVIR